MSALCQSVCWIRGCWEHNQHCPLSFTSIVLRQWHTQQDTKCADITGGPWSQMCLDLHIAKPATVFCNAQSGSIMLASRHMTTPQIGPLMHACNIICTRSWTPSQINQASPCQRQVGDCQTFWCNTDVNSSICTAQPGLICIPMQCNLIVN